MQPQKQRSRQKMPAGEPEPSSPKLADKPKEQAESPAASSKPLDTLGRAMSKDSVGGVRRTGSKDSVLSPGMLSDREQAVLDSIRHEDGMASVVTRFERSQAIAAAKAEVAASRGAGALLAVPLPDALSSRAPGGADSGGGSQLLAVPSGANSSALTYSMSEMTGSMLSSAFLSSDGDSTARKASLTSEAMLLQQSMGMAMLGSIAECSSNLYQSSDPGRTGELSGALGVPVPSAPSVVTESAPVAQIA